MDSWIARLITDEHGPPPPEPSGELSCECPQATSRRCWVAQPLICERCLPICRKEFWATRMARTNETGRRQIRPRYQIRSKSHNHRAEVLLGGGYVALKFDSSGNSFAYTNLPANAFARQSTTSDRSLSKAWGPIRGTLCIERGRNHGVSAPIVQAAFVSLTIYQRGRAGGKATRS